jgi:hypothetical protein
MNSPLKSSVVSAIKVVAFILFVVGAGLLAVWTLHRESPKENTQPATQASVVATSSNSPVQAPAAAKPVAPVAKVLPNYPDFQSKPLPVAYESSKVQWTLADGKDTNVIRQLAHNPLEYARMVEENPRIFRRQLVYLKETAASVFEQAKLTGVPVQQLTLPGMDGQELPFEIVKSQGGNGSSRQGMFSGHLVGNPDSLVTLVFMDGREAFTVLSPKENIYVVGEPREDGQVIVKAIDPSTYGQGPEEQGNDFVKAEPSGK